MLSTEFCPLAIFNENLYCRVGELSAAFENVTRDTQFLDAAHDFAGDGVDNAWQAVVALSDAEIHPVSRREMKKPTD